MVRMGFWPLVCPHGEQGGRWVWRANEQVKQHFPGIPVVSANQSVEARAAPP
jgi:hypothetical protein